MNIPTILEDDDGEADADADDAFMEEAAPVNFAPSRPLSRSHHAMRAANKAPPDPSTSSHNHPADDDDDNHNKITGSTHHTWFSSWSHTNHNNKRDSTSNTQTNQHHHHHGSSSRAMLILDNPWGKFITRLLRRTVLKPEYYLRRQLFLSFGTTAFVAIAFFVFVGSIGAQMSGSYVMYQAGHVQVRLEREERGELQETSLCCFFTHRFVFLFPFFSLQVRNMFLLLKLAQRNRQRVTLGAAGKISLFDSVK